jgi:hypothetical protein
MFARLSGFAITGATTHRKVWCCSHPAWLEKFGHMIMATFQVYRRSFDCALIKQWKSTAVMAAQMQCKSEPVERNNGPRVPIAENALVL